MKTEDAELLAGALRALGVFGKVEPELEDTLAVERKRKMTGDERTGDAADAEYYRLSVARRMMRLAAAYWRTQGRHQDLVQRLEVGLAADDYPMWN